MSDLREAAEMALDFCDDIGDLGGPYPYVNETAIVSDSRKVLQALRQALTPEVTPEVTTEVTGEVGACVTCGAPKGEWLVDAVNTSQERVYETAKREHEPAAWLIQYKTRHDIVWGAAPGLRSNDQILGMEPLYTAPPISDYHEGWEEGFKAAKREWVGLTDEEYDELMLSGDWGGSLIQATEAKLKGKNT